jgi:hypothetical protein
MLNIIEIHYLLFLFFSLLLNLGIFFDTRFELNRKILFFLFPFIFFAFSLYINKLPFDIIKDLF